MIPTAKDFYNRMRQSDMPIDLIMQGFAKRHVREALEQASEKATRSFDYVDSKHIEDSIITAYPLSNIK